MFAPQQRLLGRGEARLAFATVKAAQLGLLLGGFRLNIIILY